MNKLLIIAALVGSVAAAQAAIDVTSSTGAGAYDGGVYDVFTGDSSNGGFSKSLVTGYLGQTVTVTTDFDLVAITILSSTDGNSDVSNLGLSIYEIDDPNAGSYTLPLTSNLVFTGTFTSPATGGNNTLDSLYLDLNASISLEGGKYYMIMVDGTGASSGDFNWRRSGSTDNDFYAGGQAADNADRDFLIGLVGSGAYSLVIEPPNGYRIPKVMGASGDLALDTGYDYFDWYGITEHRTWFKPTFSDDGDTSAITTAEAFAEASEAIRQDPWRQGAASDYYFNWTVFNSELDGDEIPRRIEYLQARDIQPMIINTRRLVADSTIEGDWEAIFRVWRNWYSMVYYLASEYDIEMYEFGNESHHNYGDYDSWESHWVVAADAMRKAIDDVNTDYEKDLTLNICGPTCAGAYWDLDRDYSDLYPDLIEDYSPHGWGHVSWQKVKYDIYGNYDANNPWNYGSYDYHRYGQDAAKTELILKDLRTKITNANNDPNSDIPIVITEYNTSTGGNFDSRELDTEDLRFGTSMAPLLEASAVYGPEGLGDDGGIFIFKLGAQQSGTDLVGVGNKLSYASQNSPINYGGVTRGGACFQMYVRHFRGGKALLPVTVKAGASEDRRTMAAIDEEKGMIYIYGGNANAAGDPGTDVPVSIDLSAQNVDVGAVATLQRVDEYNTGQVTELLTVDASNKLSFECPSYTAFLIKVPLADTVPYQWELTPSEDTTQQVTDSGNLGAATTMNISMHHSDAAQRNVGLLRYHVVGAGNLSQALLKLSGRNTGTDQSEREIVHVYAVKGNEWDEDFTLDWGNAPGLGQYHVDDITMASTDGTGEMVDIEDNYAGFTSGAGTGLGLTGEFLGAVSFHSSDYVDNYLDVTDYLNSVDHDGAAPLDVTFVVARIVRYNVNEYSNDYYNLGDYHYDGRVVEIATKEHADADLQPRLICKTGFPPVIYAEEFASSNGVSLLPSSDAGGGNMVAFSEEGHSVSYDVNVSQAGTYLVGFRVASEDGSVNLELEQDGTPITTLNRFVGADETWTMVYKMVTLQAGSTTLTVSATGGEMQFLNWFELSASNGYFEDSIVEPVNIALNQPASSNSVHSSSYSAAKAVDGNFSTRWASKDSSTPWLEVDFGSTVRVNGARFVEYRDRIRSYEIQVYNDGWETAFEGGNPSADQEDWFPVVEGSKFRLNILSSTIDPTIWEFELYGVADFSVSMVGNTDAISLEWPNTPGSTYSVLHSSDLGADSWEAIESGIPALFETNSFTIEIPDGPVGFYRIMAE
ncbi:discoidin domain-containing protein [Haloferula sp.]|uniref:discoidin domain-containing protein n=1 Tax=Haloferula sp. TaxID=2497595 RepID=UPI0032A0F3A3